MRTHTYRTGSWLAAIALLLCSTLHGQAQGIDQIGSLKLVPADASFYSSSLRMKEQLDIVLASKAWAKLVSLPAIQQGLQMAHMQMQNNPQAGMAMQMLQQPENQQLVKLLGDMISQEVFVYGDSSWGTVVRTLTEANSSMQFAPLQNALAGGNPSNAQTDQFRGVLRSLMKSKADLHLPTMVIGFKVQDEAAAKAQLTRLEAAVKGLPFPEEHPMRKMLTMKTIDGGKFLTLEADGSMVPWDQIPMDKIEETPGEFKPLIDHLRGQKLKIALGYNKGFMFFLLGDSLKYLEKLGSGKNLTSQPELKPLLASAEKRITSVSYVSKGFRAAAASGNVESFDAMIAVAKQGLEKLDLTADQKARISKDLAELTQGIDKALPKYAGAISFSYLTSRGSEGYSYDWMGSALDATKPLTLLDHVGAAPILAAVARTKSSAGDYEKLEKVASKLYQYGLEIGLPKVPEEQRPHVKMAIEKLVPIAKKFWKTTRDSFIPGFADDQVGFVIDSQLSVSRLHLSMPAFPKAMPIPELAILVGVSDAKMVKQAFKEYRAELNELFAAIRELNPMAPEIHFPEAKSIELKNGVAYSFPIFGQLGVDPQIMPSAGLSDKVAVLALSPDHIGRLLGKQPLKVDGGPLADLAKPRGAATAFNPVSLLSMLEPWSEFAIVKAQEANGGEANPQMVKAIMDQAKVVFQVLKCFKGSTSSTYMEGEAVVTHSESVVKDI
ncbi:hypothetical protein BH10PLA2_BH10PLA2_17890 [soil metagenome]